MLLFISSPNRHLLNIYYVPVAATATRLLFTMCQTLFIHITSFTHHHSPESICYHSHLPHKEIKFGKTKSLAQSHSTRKRPSPEAQTLPSTLSCPSLFMPCIPYPQCTFLTQRRKPPLFWPSPIPSLCFAPPTLFTDGLSSAWGSNFHPQPSGPWLAKKTQGNPCL